MLRHGVIIENTDGVYVDATAFVESGAVLSHDVTISGRSVVKSGARIRPYTLIEESAVEAFADVGPFVRLTAGSVAGAYRRIEGASGINGAKVPAQRACGATHGAENEMQRARPREEK